MISFTSGLNVSEDNNGMRTMNTDVILNVNLRLLYPVLNANVFGPETWLFGFVSMLNRDSDFGRLCALLL